MNGKIYKITNNINKKVYIGKTLLSIEERFKQHCRDSQRNNIKNRPLYKAMNKYGQDNFYIELIEEVPIEQLSEKEQYWINYFNSFHFGYNATRGGDGKILYNYQDIVNGFLSGKLVKELAQEFECSLDTISKALKLANLDSSINGKLKNSISIKAIDPKTNLVIKEFISISEAANWLIQNNKSKGTLRNTVACISRVVSGQRKTAYNLFWVKK